MVKIYTRKGDEGNTSLWYGGRISKDDPHTQAYGALDEAISALGLARANCDDARLAKDILRLQNELFVAGAELATGLEARDRLEPGVTMLEEDMVDWLEERIDAYMAEVELPPKFVIPGGTELSARLDVARSVLRRAERQIVALERTGAIEGTSALRYVNRASDLLFAMARFADEPDPEVFEGRGRSADKAK
jgi:cob(I)alamin adenosyltransferase